MKTDYTKVSLSKQKVDETEEMFAQRQMVDGRAGSREYDFPKEGGDMGLVCGDEMEETRSWLERYKEYIRVVRHTANNLFSEVSSNGCAGSRESRHAREREKCTCIMQCSCERSPTSRLDVHAADLRNYEIALQDGGYHGSENITEHDYIDAFAPRRSVRISARNLANTEPTASLDTVVGAHAQRQWSAASNDDSGYQFSYADSVGSSYSDSTTGTSSAGEYDTNDLAAETQDETNGDSATSDYDSAVSDVEGVVVPVGTSVAASAGAGSAAGSAAEYTKTSHEVYDIEYIHYCIGTPQHFDLLLVNDGKDIKGYCPTGASHARSTTAPSATTFL